jgi:uncharacterized damage-inducible protein DinB
MNESILDFQRQSEPNAPIGLMLAMLDETTRKWRREIGRVGRETVVWQPARDAHSIGMLILHIADVEAYWLHQVVSGQPLNELDLKLLLSDETRQYAGIWPSPPKKPLSWFYEQHDRIRARTHELLSVRDDATVLIMQGNRRITLRWLIHHIIHHEAYHGGQAVLLQSLHRKLRAAGWVPTDPATIP